MGKLSYINDKLRMQTLWQLSHCLVYAEWLSKWGRLDCRFLPRDAYASRGLWRGKMSVPDGRKIASVRTECPSTWTDNYIFLLRDAVHKRGLCRRAVSVRLSRSCIVSKRLKIRP